MKTEETKNINSTKEDTQNQEIENIEESFTNSIVTRTHESKKKAAIASIAYHIALKNNDPMALKMQKFRKLWKAAKEEVTRKYGPQALQVWTSKQ